ncbi:unnamed protein product [Rotaria sp. Silwood1]|nr:unnamed protein product [Rotaria sp. Silwood1]CAF3760878.1 unnamed protein product [Rotaria sp. Silwood1]CAF4638914.1 unnamed protein product [Rotaria sp. Silwood1]CAF4925643.1 unnamed protein product [Rotaria sp. Silwood1]
MLPSQEFIKEADDEDFLSSLLYELGFGVLGVKPNSWAAKFREDTHKPASCFSALHSTASTEDGEPLGLTARFTCPNHLNLFLRMIFPIGGCPVISNSVSLDILSAKFTPMIVRKHLL